LIITLDGCVRESITHRLAALYLSSEGWLVSTDFLYLPPGNKGAPDIVAWKSPFTEKLRKAGLIEEGATLHELGYLGLGNLRNQQTHENRIDNSETLVAEVKGSDRSLGEAHKQLKKYLGWDFFDYGYGTVPGYRGGRNQTRER